MNIEPGQYVPLFGTYRGQYGMTYYFGSGQFHDGQELCNTVGIWETKVIEKIKEQLSKTKPKKFKNLYNKLTS